MDYYTNIDLLNNKLKQVALDPLEDDPTELVEGRIWYNQTQDVFKYFDGVDIHIIQRENYLDVNDIDTIWNLAE